MENLPKDYEADALRLQRRLDRERMIRLQAEEIAEKNLRELYTKQEELKLLQQIAVAANEADSIDQIMATALELICKYTEWPIGHAYLPNQHTRILKPTVIWHVSLPDGFASFKNFTEQTCLAAGVGLPGRAFVSAKAEWIKDVAEDDNFPRAAVAQEHGIRSGFAFPVLHGQEVVAILEFYDIKVHEADVSLIEITTHIAMQLSRVIERCRAHEQNLVQMERLSVLHTIDIAIADDQDLFRTLGICLEQASHLLKVKAAGILLFDAESERLQYSVGHNLAFDRAAKTFMQSKDSPAWQIVLHRQKLHLDNISRKEVNPFFPEYVCNIYRQYYGVPLIAKGEIRGVLELFDCEETRFDEGWTAFLETLAGQIAIAIDNTVLFEHLQLSNLELIVAYDATIEGWSRALDLRDKETEGHCRRVTEMTLSLAEALGYDPEEMVGLRRGALLHDIGKMGIPDDILLKPGPLTEEEWVVMRRHPQYAYDLLAPISFLESALDIPYCHHEKWDGTGYPRRLSGEDIPFAARIFAVVDVWDALRSDRPYRKGWSDRRIMEHIHSLSGSHFDPVVADAFLKLLQGDSLADYGQRAA